MNFTNALLDDPVVEKSLIVDGVGNRSNRSWVNRRDSDTGRVQSQRESLVEDPVFRI